jgi:hypothetical protein
MILPERKRFRLVKLRCETRFTHAEVVQVFAGAVGVVQDSAPVVASVTFVSMGVFGRDSL